MHILTTVLNHSQSTRPLGEFTIERQKAPITSGTPSADLPKRSRHVAKVPTADPIGLGPLSRNFERRCEIGHDGQARISVFWGPRGRRGLTSQMATSRLIPHRHCRWAELQPAHELQFECSFIAKPDGERAEVVRILQDQEPPWRGTCREGMVMWIAERM